ncbi:MAG: carboxypeptidase-like regulatory domain-containing protein [Prevotellaceae bacterium]|jgi:hypothetical protein|nr:carboxypeptidase-like regulatory domain-containing protein [Prevotellaceae bacterium]
MKKTFIFIIANLLFINSFAQTNNKIFVADSTTREPVEYASIIFVGTDGGAYTNDKGFFYKPQNVKQIEVSGIGYYSKKVALNKDIDTIFLSPQVYELSEAKVLPANKKRKSVELGYAQKNSIRGVGYCSGDEIAVYIPLDNEENSYRLIKQVIFNIARNFKLDKLDNTSVFKVNFYKITGNKEIGELINTENIVFTSDILKSKPKLDVSKYNVYMPEDGIFVAIEFVGRINFETGAIIGDLMNHILPSVRVSWEIPNTIVYEKRKFRKSKNGWQRVDKDYDVLKGLKQSYKDLKVYKDLKEDEYYTPLFSIVLE